MTKNKSSKWPEQDSKLGQPHCKYARWPLGHTASLVILHIRNTPQERIYVSPVQQMMNRQTRSPLHKSANLLTPQIITGVHGRIKQWPSTDPTTNSRWLQLERGMCHQAGDTKVLWRRIWWKILYSQPERNQPHPKPLQLPSSSPQLIAYSGAYVTKTRSGRISVPPASWTFYSDFALIFHFFCWFFGGGPTYFLVFSLPQKGLDSCHDLILCTLVSYNYVHMEILCVSQLHHGMAHTVRGVGWSGHY